MTHHFQKGKYYPLFRYYMNICYKSLGAKPNFKGKWNAGICLINVTAEFQHEWKLLVIGLILNILNRIEPNFNYVDKMFSFCKIEIHFLGVIQHLRNVIFLEIGMYIINPCCNRTKRTVFSLNYFPLFWENISRLVSIRNYTKLINLI